MQFVDITNDIAFRKIFGNENKKIILLSFLNAVMKLKGKDVIDDVDILNPYQLPIIKNLKFIKLLEDLIEVTDKWIFFIKEAENLEVIPANVDDEGLKEAYKDANKHAWTKQELEAYDYAAMREQDERGKLVHAENRGRKEREIEMARAMKMDNETIEKIIKYTGLTEDEIHNI